MWDREAWPATLTSGMWDRCPMKEVYSCWQPRATTASSFKRYPLFSQSKTDLVRRKDHGKQQDHWQQGRNGGVEDVAEQLHRRKIEDSCRERIVTNGHAQKANLGSRSIRSVQSPSGRPDQRSVENRGGQRTRPSKRQEKVGGFEFTQKSTLSGPTVTSS